MRSLLLVGRYLWDLHVQEAVALKMFSNTTGHIFIHSSPLRTSKTGWLNTMARCASSRSVSFSYAISAMGAKKWQDVRPLVILSAYTQDTLLQPLQSRGEHQPRRCQPSLSDLLPNDLRTLDVILTLLWKVKARSLVAFAGNLRSAHVGSTWIFRLRSADATSTKKLPKCVLPDSSDICAHSSLVLGLTKGVKSLPM